MPRTSASLTRLICAGIFFFSLSLILTAYSVAHPETSRFGSRIVRGVVYPLEFLYLSANDAVRIVLDEYIVLYQVRDQNKILRSKLQALEQKASALLEVARENQRLRKLTGLQSKLEPQGVVANVIGFGPSNWSQTLEIDKGTSSGVSRDMIAISGNGLVGRVVKVLPGRAQILLISDPRSSVDALIQRNRVRGLVQGVGRFQSEWRYVSQDSYIVIGDRLISSGLDKSFPKGLAVGVVSHVSGSKIGDLFQKIKIRPFVDFVRLEAVLVVEGEEL